LANRVVWVLAVLGAAGTGLSGWWVWWLPPLLATCAVAGWRLTRG
jgi:hypothetical protein